MWIERIELKVNRGSYLCWEELIQDVTLIVHNCYIANENHDARSKESARNLLKTIKQEISAIALCSDCYLNDVFTKSCVSEFLKKKILKI